MVCAVGFYYAVDKGFAQMKTYLVSSAEVYETDRTSYFYV
jgi:hypothetical protein